MDLNTIIKDVEGGSTTKTVTVTAPPPSSTGSNTVLYIGIAVGAILLIGGITTIILMSKK